eukprot:IDg654t1
MSEDMIQNDMFAVSQTSIKSFIQGCGSFVHNIFEKLASDEKLSLVQAIGKLSVDLALKVHLIEPEQGGESYSKTDLPPCLPNELAKMTPGDFVSATLRFRMRLEKVMKTADIEAIEEDHRSI